MNHNRIHYVLAGLLAAALLGGGAYLNARLDAVPVERTSPLAWAEPDAQQEADLTAAMQALGAGEVTIWCGTYHCAGLAEDLQYVAYMADWATHSAVPFYTDPGITVTPNDAVGKSLAEALGKVLGVEVATIPADAKLAPGHHIVLGEKP